MTYFDFAAALQARTCTDLEAEKIAHMSRARRDRDERSKDDWLEAHIVALEEAVAHAEILAEQRRQEAETGAKKIAELETHITTLQQTITKAETLSEQQRQEAETAKQRADHLVAELVDLTEEFVGMSKRVAEQTAAMDKLRAELDDYRSRCRAD